MFEKGRVDCIRGNLLLRSSLEILFYFSPLIFSLTWLSDRMPIIANVWSATFLFFLFALFLSPVHVGLAGKGIFAKSFSKVLYLLSNAFLDGGVKTRLVCKSEWPYRGEGNGDRN